MRAIEAKYAIFASNIKPPVTGGFRTVLRLLRSEIFQRPSLFVVKFGANAS